MGARSEIIRSKSRSKDCSTTWVAIRTLPRRCSAVPVLPKLSSTWVSILWRSTWANRAWNNRRSSSPTWGSSWRYASCASSTRLRIQHTQAPSLRAPSTSSTTWSNSETKITSRRRASEVGKGTSSNPPGFHFVAKGNSRAPKAGAGPPAPWAKAATSPARIPWGKVAESRMALPPR